MTSITFYARGDSSTANNAALNAQGINSVPTVELVFESTIGGDIVLDYHNGDPDPTTVVYVDGVERNFWVEFSGVLPDSNKLANVNGVDLRGEEIVVITTDDGQRYFFLTNGTTSLATMDKFPNGAHALLNFSSSSDVYVCFVSGTRIATPTGKVPVEQLLPGDLVLTADGRHAPVLYVSRRKVSVAELICKPDSRPVCIAKDGLGKGRPYRDLWLSQQHRVMVTDWQAELLFAQKEVLVHAKHLPRSVLRQGTEIVSSVVYHHILLDRHSVILSNGLETESLFPGDLTIQSLGETSAKDLQDTLSKIGMSAQNYGLTAQRCLRKWEANLLFHFENASKKDGAGKAAQRSLVATG